MIRSLQNLHCFKNPDCNITLYLPIAINKELFFSSLEITMSADLAINYSRQIVHLSGNFIAVTCCIDQLTALCKTCGIRKYIYANKRTKRTITCLFW